MIAHRVPEYRGKPIAGIPRCIITVRASPCLRACERTSNPDYNGHLENGRSGLRQGSADSVDSNSIVSGQWKTRHQRVADNVRR